jgi:ABC-type cobalt transport system substrate-binding protein
MAPETRQKFNIYRCIWVVVMVVVVVVVRHEIEARARSNGAMGGAWGEAQMQIRSHRQRR